ncbi:MAG: hypothetical protein QW039_04540 [Fervidicoccaceae archaeon]
MSLKGLEQRELFEGGKYIYYDASLHNRKVHLFMVKCPFCGYEGEIPQLKSWKFRFYSVARMQCPKCNGIFNYYRGEGKGGKVSEFTIKVKPRRGK